MIYRRRRREIKAEINVIPFLDVLLVLLLIFMMTAPIITQSVQVDLPKALDSKTVLNDDKMPVILEVTHIGEYSLVLNGKRYEKLSASTVIDMVKKVFDNDKSTIFLVGGAKDAPYEEIIKSLNLLHLAGIHQAGLMTKPL